MLTAKPMSGIWMIDQDCATVYTCSNVAEVLCMQQDLEKTIPVTSYVPILNELLNSPSTTYPVLIDVYKNQTVSHKVELIATPLEVADKKMWILEFRKYSAENELITDNESTNNTLFEDSPIPIWDEDFSAIKQKLDQYKALGVSSIRDFLTENPEEINHVLRLLKVNRINNAVVELNEATSKEEVLNKYIFLTTPESNEYILQQLEAIWNKEKKCEFDAKLITLKGNIRFVNFKWTVVEGFEEDYSRVFLTTTDLTRRIKDENLSLQQANREKETLLKEIHHRVKNNLQIITSLIRLQLGSTHNREAQQLLEVSLSRISSIASVHELLYQSNQFASIDYSEYIHQLVESLVNTMVGDKEVKVEMEVEDVKMPLEMAIPLGLLINEILTNSIKHAFSDEQEKLIFLKLKKQDDQRIVLTIGDNGKGFKGDIAEENHETLGLSLIQNLAEQLSADLKKMKVPGTVYESSFELEKRL